MSSIRNNLIRADRSLFCTINKLQIGYMNKFFLLITNLGGVLFQVCLITILALFPNTRSISIRLAFSQIIVTAVVQTFKFSIGRERPYDTMNWVVPLKKERDYSFPSGHTAAAFTSAITIGSALPSISEPSLLLAALIAYSRIYLGIHYPSDVAAGCVIGVGLTIFLV